MLSYEEMYNEIKGLPHDGQQKFYQEFEAEMGSSFFDDKYKDTDFYTYSDLYEIYTEELSYVINNGYCDFFDFEKYRPYSDYDYIVKEITHSSTIITNPRTHKEMYEDIGIDVDDKDSLYRYINNLIDEDEIPYSILAYSLNKHDMVEDIISHEFYSMSDGIETYYIDAKG